jgi:uncharacterized membrane protein YfcA
VLPTLPASRRAAPYVGVLSGVLSSSVSMGGTPIMLYLIGLREGEKTPHELRATAVVYVILSTVGSLAVLFWTGLVDTSSLIDAVILAPAAVIGFGLGALVFRYVSRTLFLRLTLIMLALAGLFALVAAIA